MLLDNNLYEQMLIAPREQCPGINSLLVVSGYATAAMASYYIEDLQKREMGIKTKLIVGMTPRDGLRASDHKGFVSLMNNFPDEFSCSYVVNQHPPVHSKLYVFCEKSTPKMAFMGSANYTQTALFSKQGEIITNCDPILGLNYFCSIESQTMYCNHAEVENSVTFYTGGRLPESNTESYEGFDSVSVSLLTSDGAVGGRSGLNWGQRPEAGRDPNQAYIPLKAEIYRTTFFPEVGKHFTVLTDDNRTLICSRAQQNGKAIHTPLNNSHIGEYFRNRLGVPNGAQVTHGHLSRHGRTDVTFFKVDEENYYMDFG